MYNDKNLTCADCGQEFVFTASEQDFYAQRGFTEPRRCAVLPGQPQGRPQRGGRRQLVRRLRRRRRLLRRRFRLRRRWRRLRLPRPRPPRDVHGHLLVLRQGRPGPVPPDQRQARLLQRLLPEPARRLTQVLSVRADPRPAEPARSSTRVVSRPGSFDSRRACTSYRSGACRRAGPGRTCAPCRGAGGRCCRRGPARSARRRPPSR